MLGNAHRWVAAMRAEPDRTEFPPRNALVSVQCTWYKCITASYALRTEGGDCTLILHKEDKVRRVCQD